MLLILLVVFLAVLAWIVLKPTWLPQPPENQVTKTISGSAVRAATATKTITGNVTGTTGNWLKRLRMPFQRRAELGQQLKIWASTMEVTDQAGLVVWLGGLTDEQADQLANDLAAFCRSYNLELAWLFDTKVNAELKSVLEEVVIFHSLAIWKVRSAQPLAVFQRWQLAPHHADNRIFTRQLYTRLVTEGLANAPAELLLASAQERETYVVRAIQSAAAENHVAVLAQVVELCAAEEAAKIEKAQSARKTKKHAPSADSPSEMAQAIVA